MLIDCQLEDLVKERDLALREWFGKSECRLLIKVAEAQAKKHATAALVKASEANEGNLLLEASNVELRQAQRWVTFLEILNHLLAQKEPFQTAKLY